MILAGDIGGTKTTLALFKLRGNRLEVQVKYQFSSKEFATLYDVLKAFEDKAPIPSLKAACFGVAGPVIDGYCQTTNLPWEIDRSNLSKYLHTDEIHLTNDLSATAYGMLYLPEDHFINLNLDAHTIDANRAVIAAGTGLGEAMLFYDGKEYHPIASEGGHCDFAPVNEQQEKLLQWLRHRYPEHVSYERILSGPGIATLYAFLVQSAFAPEPACMIDIPEGMDRSAMVSDCALKERDPLCLETLRLFVEIYGAEAGNLALKSMSRGGVYIGGGIAPKILAVLSEHHFMHAFLNKGRFKNTLGKMPVKISLNPDTALLGAAYFALKQLENRMGD